MLAEIFALHYRGSDMSGTRLFQFLVVGAICSVLGLVTLWICTGVLGIHYLLSTTVAFFLINPVGYLLNRQFTFKNTSSRWPQQLARYYLVMATSLFANLGLMFVLVDGLSINYLLANVFAIVLLVFYNFWSHSAWTFGRDRFSLRERD